MVQEEKEEVRSPSGVDGWLEPRDTTQGVAKEVEDGKTMAILSHASLLFGIPIFIVPMITRDNRFALHHAKAAAVTFTLFFITAMLTMVSCGVFFPLLLLCYIPALVGIVQAANGQLAGPWGMGNAGESVLRGLKVPIQKLPKHARHQLEHHEV